MIMLDVKMTDKVPFSEVYCHSLVRDSEFKKMSKSLRNIIDSLDVVSGVPLQALHNKLYTDNLHLNKIKKATKYQKTAFPDGIPQCGTDALRFALVEYTTGGGDIAFDIKVIHKYRKFCNKIYQAMKYVLGSLPLNYVSHTTGARTGKKSLAEKWILHKLTHAVKGINKALADREFAHFTTIVYQYWYNYLCDVYIENSKAIIHDGTEEEKRSAIDTLYTALDSALTMIHPFMPFVTKELWQRLSRRPEDKTPSIVLAKYAEFDAELNNPKAETAYELVLDVFKGICSLMTEYSLKDKAKGKHSYPLTKKSMLMKIQSMFRPTARLRSTPSPLRCPSSSPSVAKVLLISASSSARTSVWPVLWLSLFPLKPSYICTSRVTLTSMMRSLRQTRSLRRQS